MTAATRAGEFHLDALSSGIPLNVDLDTTPDGHRRQSLPAAGPPATPLPDRHPDKLWRHFRDTGGTLHITDNAATCALNLRSYHPVLVEAGEAGLDVPIPWWEGPTLRRRFPPR